MKTKKALLGLKERPFGDKGLPFGNKEPLFGDKERPFGGKGLPFGNKEPLLEGKERLRARKVQLSRL